MMKNRLTGRTLLLASLALSLPLGVSQSLQAVDTSVPVGSGAAAFEGTATAEATPVKTGSTPVLSETGKTGQLSTDARRAIELFWEASRCLRSDEESVRARGRQLLEESASLEFAQAQDYLGHCYLDGSRGFPKDQKKGVNWLRLASVHGLAYSKVALAACELSGYGVAKDFVDAEKLLREALGPEAVYALQSPPADFKQEQPSQEEGDSTVLGAVFISPAERSRALAHFLLGELYSIQGKHGPAQAEYLLAARQGDGGRAGHYKACIKAALNYAFGRGVPRDSRKAGELLEISRQLSKRMGSAYARSLVDSKQVDTFAQADVEDQLQRQAQQEERRMSMEVASSLSNKKSPHYDIAEAFRWLEVSVEDGQSWAMNSLALLYLDPKAGRLNETKARELFKAAADKDGDSLAWSNYAICLHQGLGGAKDPAAAMEIFKKRQGYDILNRLGFLGRCPAAPMSYEERLKLTMKLAEKDDPQALYFLGCYLIYGTGKEESRRVGLSLMMKSANLGNEEAMTQLGTLLLAHGLDTKGEQGQEYLRSAFGYLKRGADKGSIPALVLLGRCHQDGVGGIKNEDEAMRIFELCLQKDPEQAPALNNISQIYYARYAEAAMRLDEAGMEAMRAKMFGYLEAADKKGFVLAAKSLGMLHYDGLLGKKDFSAAYQHFDDAANRGDVYSRRMLGVMLELGQGMPVSYAEAAYHYRIAALAGDRHAMDQLCRFYRAGLGVSRDPERAIYWLKLSLKNGNSMARVQIADVLLECGDARAARQILEEASRADLVKREFQGAFNHRLGLMYERGLGVPLDVEKGHQLRASALASGDPDELLLRSKELLEEQNVKEALPLLTRAMRAGQRQAGFMLGQLYEEGLGISKDPMMAVRCYRQATDQGHKEAMFRLARYSLRGAFGAPSYDEALNLCAQAETAGVPSAEALRVELERRRALRQN